jgi:hypothetical protein
MQRLFRTLALGTALLALVVVAGCASTSWCPASPSAPYPEASTLAWQHRMSGDAVVTDVAVDGAGGVVATGKFNGAFGVDDAVEARPVHGSGLFVAAFDRGGAVRWLRVVAGQDASGGLHVALDEGGGVYLLGWTHGPFELGAVSIDGGRRRAAFVARLGPDGVPAWAHAWHEGIEALGGGRPLSVNAAGEALVAARGLGGDGPAIVAFDRRGEQRWRLPLGPRAGQSLHAEGGGRTFIALDEGGALRFGALDGPRSIRWSPAASLAGMTANRLAVSASGTALLVGYDRSGATFLLALDAAGAKLFSVRPSTGVAVLDAAPSGRGSWLVAGATRATDVDLCRRSSAPGHQAGFVGELGPRGELIRGAVLAGVTSVDRIVATEGGPAAMAGFELRRAASVAARRGGCLLGDQPSVATLGFGYVSSEPFRRCQEIQLEVWDGFVSLLGRQR